MSIVYCFAWKYAIKICCDDILSQEIQLIKDVGGIPLSCVKDYSGNLDLILNIIKASKPEFYYRNGEYYLKINTELGVRRDSLRNLIGQFVSVAAMINDTYTLHSSAVETDGKATILLGESGAGKTILSLYLCNRFDYNWLANDWSAINLGNNGCVELICGYDEISIRYESLDNLLPFVNHGLRSELKKCIPHTKKVFSTAELMIRRGALPCNIGYIYSIDINKSSFVHKKLSEVEKRDLLYENMTWVTKGKNSELYDCNDNELIDCICAFTESSKLLEIIDTVCNTIIVEKISGRINEVANYIRRQYED